MAKASCDIGMIGLGVMGSNLSQNISDHGFTIACFDQDPDKVKALQHKEAQGIYSVSALDEFIALLRTPRVIFLLVPAGPPVDSVIAELTPHLQDGDIIIDGGNSYYKDTEFRAKELSQKGKHFFGIGVSGGEEGARLGPSLMPGGEKSVYNRFGSILEAIAAKVDGTPCVSYLGPRSAGHFVKMVHNGIEYGIMQLISETYDLLKRYLGLDNDALSDVYHSWSKTEVESYLLEITAQIFKKEDIKTHQRLIDVILDVSKQKGTGMWTSQSAMELGIPTPNIDIAVGVRHLSMEKDLREKASVQLNRAIRTYQGDRKAFIEQVRQAFYVGMAMTYAQGMALLNAASEKLKYDLDLDKVATIWRGGCIIRAAFLEDIRAAYQKNPDLPHLLFDPDISKKILAREEALRNVIKLSAESGVPLPGLMSALSYLDGIRSGWLPANLIQAQRDFFGSHTYERTDAKGTYHSNWESDELKSH